MLMFLTAVSLAVAAIPEALPAVVTVSLALGARRLSRRNALVRRLPAVESLGSVTYICTDKTGTLTENRMVLESLFAAGSERSGLDALDGTLRRRLGEALALCNVVAVDDGELTGDPTEVALVRAAASAGFEKRALLRESPLVGELAFDSARKRMTTVHERHGRRVAYVKGAPEQTVSRCRDTLGADGDTRVLEAAPLLEEAEKLAGRGHRVLAVAYRELPAERHALRADEIEAGLTFLAFVALDDPPRVEARQAIEDCRLAGITPVMITGDHPVTARQIAATLALTDDDEISTGRQVAELDDERLLEHVRRVRVYARVDPEQKIRIVEALQRSGELVAMTGDGVNDAPALKQATIGVAMGKRGTDVAREAADMVLLDDNFATIVMAIREGRRVYDNIRKFIRYTMTSNAGEIWVLLLAPLIGLPLPLLPIHILWINLVTDGFPGLAFSGERAEADVMRRPPRPPGESVFAHGTWQHIFWAGLVIAGLSLVTAAWTGTQNLVYWQTMVFTTLVTAQLFQALALRSEISSLARIGLFSNPYMIVTVAATLAAQLIVVYAPPFNALLHTAPLALADLSICLALGSATLPVIEIQKWLARRRRTAAPLRAVERA
jgi:Ca2+-transporting ATPase